MDTDSAHPHDVTQLLQAMQRGEEGASDALARLVYSDLHDLAIHFMNRERNDHTLQPTILVHDAYLRLVDQNRTDWKNRTHFYGIAARVMRRILVDYARKKNALKRSSGERITLDESIIASSNTGIDILSLDDALNTLSALDARQSSIVEMRFFAGLTMEQTAEVLGVSLSTVSRDWVFAKAFLKREMEIA